MKLWAKTEINPVHKKKKKKRLPVGGQVESDTKGHGSAVTAALGGRSGVVVPILWARASDSTEPKPGGSGASARECGAFAQSRRPHESQGRGLQSS